jgi:hypothetical protein
MGLRQTLAQWIATLKDTLDFGPEFPAAAAEQRATFAQELSELQHLLEQTRQAVQEKDELIARLQAAGNVRGDMIIDGSAYYIQKGSVLEGPFCLSCFEHSHQLARLGAAPMPKDAEGDPSEWVQCPQCQTPFRSERLGHYLPPRRTASPAAASAVGTSEAKATVRPARKPRTQLRSPKEQPPARGASRRKAAR